MHIRNTKQKRTKLSAPATPLAFDDISSSYDAKLMLCLTATSYSLLELTSSAAAAAVGFTITSKTFTFAHCARTGTLELSVTSPYIIECEFHFHFAIALSIAIAAHKLLGVMRTLCIKVIKHAIHPMVLLVGSLCELVRMLSKVCARSRACFSYVVQIRILYTTYAQTSET